MAWKEVEPMEERIRFVLIASKQQVVFSDLCAEFGVSRKTGYKWLNRYRKDGLDGVRELSRRPCVSPSKTPCYVEKLILRERLKHKKWGPKKIRELLKVDHGLAVVPSVSTIGNILKKHGLTKKKKRRRAVRQPDRTTRTEAKGANDVWAVDFKGWFRTRDGSRCDPLTCTDLFSRYVLICRIVSGQTIEAVVPEFRKAFMRYGLPEVIRVDNGSPFGSRGICGLTKLSAWWVGLGIRVEFIDPGHPEQNGSHERMHWTLKDETMRPPSATPKAQQARFDRWRREFNHQRPHEAIGMQKPAMLYVPSKRRFSTCMEPFAYPLHYDVRNVKTHGTIKWCGEEYYVGEALHGMTLGITDVADQTYAVYFRDLLLGYFRKGEHGALRPTWDGELH